MSETLNKFHTIADTKNNVYYLYDEDDNKIKIPESLAIILDGNGRYAEKMNIARAEGHRAGCAALEKILEESVKLGIKFLTVYAFSTENWKRSEDEINSLFSLFFLYLDKIKKSAIENNVKIFFIGDITKFPEKLSNQCEKLMSLTKDNSGLVFSIAFNYGSRDEILRAIKKISKSVDNIDDLTEKDFSKFLDTSGIKDPDFLIRTSGEIRLSNFLLWQSAYTELYFTDTLWPEFSIEEFYNALSVFSLRSRRYGGR